MTEPAPISEFIYSEKFKRDNPDRIETRPIKLWVFADTLRCAIYPSPIANGINGYVQLPEGSADRTWAEAYNDMENARHREPDVRDRDVIPWNQDHRVGYDILHELRAPGGLTYGPDEDGWIGFDTGHAWDDWSQDEYQRVLRPDNEDVWQKLLEYQAKLGADSWPPSRIMRRGNMRLPGDMDWTLEKLEAEVELLAAQVYERLRGAPVLNGC